MNFCPVKGASNPVNKEPVADIVSAVSVAGNAFLSRMVFDKGGYCVIGKAVGIRLIDAGTKVIFGISTISPTSASCFPLLLTEKANVAANIRTAAPTPAAKDTSVSLISQISPFLTFLIPFIPCSRSYRLLEGCDSMGRTECAYPPVTQTKESLSHLHPAFCLLLTSFPA